MLESVKRNQIHVLVTGGTGFVGSHVVEELLKSGYQVTALVRNRNQLRWLAGQPVQLLESSLLSEPVLPHSITHVIHLAGLTKALSEREYQKGNVETTQQLLNAVQKLPNPIDRFLHISSQAAAGPSDPAKPRIESDPPNPVTWYGSSKLLAENLVQEFAAKFPITIIRPPAIYGPRDTDVLNIFKFVNWGINLTVGADNQLISMVYVKNLVHAILTALFNDKAIGETYFITDGEVLTMKQIVDMVATALGKKYRTIRLPFTLANSLAFVIEKFSSLTGKVSILNRQKMIEVSKPSWALNINKARNDLSYVPLFTTEQAIQETAKWYKENNWI